jgi:multisubunit Na+/H+ antiporter MnhE subunit
MYAYARKKAHVINLSPVELFETNSQIIINFLNCLIAAMAAVAVLFFKPKDAGNSGMVYISIPIVYTVLFSVRGKMRRKVFGDVTNNEPA